MKTQFAAAEWEHDNTSGHITVKTFYKPDWPIVTQELQVMQGEISRWIMNTREKQLRDALIALGWTPPVESEQNGIP